jgi:hypothetical protein
MLTFAYNYLKLTITILIIINGKLKCSSKYNIR